jgi:hypothetical protein
MDRASVPIGSLLKMRTTCPGSMPEIRAFFVMDSSFSIYFCSWSANPQIISLAGKTNQQEHDRCSALATSCVGIVPHAVAHGVRLNSSDFWFSMP